MTGEFTSIEKRVRGLEQMMEALRAALDALRHKLGPVAEAQGRQQPDESGAGLLFRAQAVGLIPDATGNAPGMGTARFLQTIDLARYKVRPIAEGDVTFPCANDTGGPIDDKAYLVCAMVQGVFTAIVADCVNADAADAPDPPTT